MFGLWNRNRPDVLKHWYSLLENFQCDTAAFYSAIETELQTQQVPGLSIERVEFAEGSLLSAKRLYLRMSRERLVFDVCAAPFGTCFFFSCRFAEIPVVLRIWEVIVLVLAFIFGFVCYIQFFGFFFGILLLLATIVGFFAMGRNLVALGMGDLDASLLKIPVIGAFYEAFIRKETYYREDTRIMYVELVDRIVKRKVEGFTAAKGVKQVEFTDATSSPKTGLLSTILDAINARR